MRVEEALVTKLRATSAVSTLVSTRIYPSHAPQTATTPYVVFDLVGGNVLGTHDGGSSLRDGRVSFSCIASTYASAKAIAKAIKGTLSGLKETLSGVAVAIHTTYEDEDMYDDLLSLHVVVTDFELIWLE